MAIKNRQMSEIQQKKELDHANNAGVRPDGPGHVRNFNEHMAKIHDNPVNQSRTAGPGELNIGGGDSDFVRGALESFRRNDPHGATRLEKIIDRTERESALRIQEYEHAEQGDANSPRDSVESPEPEAMILDAHEAKHKGSWDAVSRENWDRTQRFWDDGQQPWSADRATIKRSDAPDRGEFEEMRTLQIPGRYLQHKDTTGRIDKSAYIPVGLHGGWQKAFGDQGRVIGKTMARGEQYHDWLMVEHILRPDVRIDSPGGTQHYVEQREGSIKKYHDDNFKDREGENSIAFNSFKTLFSARERTKGYKRKTDIPDGSVKERLGTPIIWETNPADQGS
jgi:hypothetical protein